MTIDRPAGYEELELLIGASKAACRAGAATLPVVLEELRRAGKAYDEAIRNENKFVPTHHNITNLPELVRYMGEVPGWDGDDYVIFEVEDGTTRVCLLGDWQECFKKIDPPEVIDIVRVEKHACRAIWFDGKKETAAAIEEWLGTGYRVQINTILSSLPSYEIYEIEVWSSVDDVKLHTLSKGDYVVNEGTGWRFIKEFEFGDLGYQTR